MHVTGEVEEIARAHHRHRFLAGGARRLLEVKLRGDRNHEDEILAAFALRDERLEDMIGIFACTLGDIDARIATRCVDGVDDMLDMRGIKNAHGVCLVLLLLRHSRTPVLRLRAT